MLFKGDCCKVFRIHTLFADLTSNSSHGLFCRFFKLIMVGLASVISGLALTYGIMFGQDERIAVRNLVKAKNRIIYAKSKV